MCFLRAPRGLLGELPGLPYLPEVPGRGAIANLTGRTLAVVAELGADLQPAGWRLTGSGGSSGVDHRRARSLLARDLDALEEIDLAYPKVDVAKRKELKTVRSALEAEGRASQKND